MTIDVEEHYRGMKPDEDLEAEQMTSIDRLTARQQGISLRQWLSLHAVSTMVNRTDHDFAADTYYPARGTLQALAMRSVRSTEIMQM